MSAYVIRWPRDGNPIPHGLGTTNGGQDGVNNAWLEDTRDGSCVFVDGIEPEDATLSRDLEDLVDELNNEATKTDSLLAATHAAGERIARLEATQTELLALLDRLVALEGPQPGDVEWYRDVQAAMRKARGGGP